MSADIEDDSLCRWTKNDDAESGLYAYGEGADEWLVYGTPEQGAAEYATVCVLSKRSGRITRVLLGEEVSYCMYCVAERLEVVYEGERADGAGDWDSGVSGSREFRWHHNEDRHAGAGAWLVRGEPGRAGSSVIVVNRHTKKGTAVFLTKEVGRAYNGSLYEFVRC